MQYQGRRTAGKRLGWMCAAAVFTLAGCSSVPLTSDTTPPSPLPTPAPTSAPAPVARADLPNLPPAGSGRGGYYLDDGPGDNPPDGLHDIPDAEPRIEPYTTRGNRPYVVFGKNYTPFTDDRPYKARGRGSWYGKKFHGQTTSSGEPYDMYKMTAAHPTLPLPSYVRVTNLENGRQVIVRVNDRGPFVAGRIIDLSYTAALKLGYLTKGSALLEVERLLPDEIRRMAQERERAAPPAVLATSGGAETAEAAEVAQPDMPERVALASEAVFVQTPAQPVLVPAASTPMTGSGIFLQLGAFGQAANAAAARQRFGQQSGLALPPIEVVEQGGLFRLFSGPFASRADAEAAAMLLQRSIQVSPLIVQR
ncbi:MAG TPA: septal ring lytic transglycosylase RlpA family protein [Noviherbaspirillum sp.]|nr:septal ring lytic transglycosylase RlpA family protein [Noviherbaspirillum sp.]